MVASVVSLHGPKEGSTPPAVAQAMREALEKMIERGIIGGIVSGETFDGCIGFDAVPPIGSFAYGHVLGLKKIMEDGGEDEE